MKPGLSVPARGRQKRRHQRSGNLMRRGEVGGVGPLSPHDVAAGLGKSPVLLFKCASLDQVARCTEETVARVRHPNQRMIEKRHVAYQAPEQERQGERKEQQDAFLSSG